MRANDCQSHLLTCKTMLEYLSPKEQLTATYMEYNEIFGPCPEAAREESASYFQDVGAEGGPI